MMRVLVFGGRHYADRRRLYEVLDAFHARTPITLIIEGEMSGADRLAREWAESRGVELIPTRLTGTTSSARARWLSATAAVSNTMPRLVRSGTREC